MCGRFTITRPMSEIIERFNIHHPLFEISPRYNIAPSQQIPVITDDGGERTLAGYKWGLVPSWAKDEKIGNKMINARAETLLEKPAFKQALTKRRCLIPADGFYEWQAQGKLKQPIYLRRRDHALFAFAGLWEEWRSPAGELLRTATIITTEPNRFISEYHHRMAKILTPAQEAIWLDDGLRDTEVLAGILKPAETPELEAFPVSRLVNSPTADGPGCIEPAEQPRLF